MVVGTLLFPVVTNDFAMVATPPLLPPDQILELVIIPVGASLGMGLACHGLPIVVVPTSAAAAKGFGLVGLEVPPP
jgi:hypothetical protein